MAYRITYSDRGSLIDCSGTFNMQELHKANGALHGYEGFDRHTYQIWNLVNADMSLISEKEMIEPAGIDHAAETYIHKMKVALVVQNQHAAKLCESYKKNIREFGSKWDCRIFNSMNEAQKWAQS